MLTRGNILLLFFSRNIASHANITNSVCSSRNPSLCVFLPLETRNMTLNGRDVNVKSV